MASLLYFSGTMLYLSASDSEAVNQVEFAFLSMFLLLLIADIKQGKKLTICFFFFFFGNSNCRWNMIARDLCFERDFRLALFLYIL